MSSLVTGKKIVQLFFFALRDLAYFEQIEKKNVGGNIAL